MIYGYIRVSTEKQCLENKIHEISLFMKKQNLEVDKWVKEITSSRHPLMERKLGKALCQLHDGDILIATEISRLGRNLLEVMGILQVCLEKNCQVWTLKENYKLGSDIQSKVLAFAFSLASEIERQLISDRTKNSLKRLKDEGKHLGRPFGFSYRKLKKKHNKIKKLLKQNVSKTEIARTMGCTWSTLQRYIKSFIS